MMRSLYSGVSGLQNHQTRMDVIGNNISNVNTVGFKKGRVTFQDMISQNMAGAARPTEELGGINPKQVGLGMTVASIDNIFNQGSLQTTGNTTDVALSGEGFFVTGWDDKRFYTRAGAFGLDAEGILVNPANGFRILGWRPQVIDGQVSINTAGDITDLFIPVGSKDPASSTGQVELACNLDKRTPEIPPEGTAADVQRGTWTIDKEIYDSFGNPHLMQISFSRVPDVNNQWQVAVLVDPAEDVATNTLIEVGEDNNTTNLFTLTFDNLGALQEVTDAQGDTITTGDILVPVSFDLVDATPGADGALVRQTFNLNLGEVGSYTDTVTQFAETSSTKAFRQDGYGMGYMESFRIDDKGEITGIYSNGQIRALGQIALASFINPQGLEKTGETQFQETINSGEALIGPAGVAGKGKMMAGALEMSNVDLAEQFTDMIVTQRGFQANSKTITTSDTMLQELLTLKR